MKNPFGKNLLLNIVLIFGLLILASGCAEVVSFEEAANKDPVGFWYGLWHGVIAPITFIVSLFDTDTAVYAIYNNGGWYDFGFLFGLSASIGGSSKAS